MNDTRNRRSSDEFEVLYNENYKLSSKKELSIQDKKSILVLIFLYILQGIPLGLAGSVPLILQSYKVSYSTQATFSLAFWPFSLKIMWAPIVDSVFVSRWGRRKTWLIPVQLLIGVTMLIVSANVSSWLGTEVSVLPLTVSFFLLTLLAATQDIAVDGWALTMLSRQSVGWASTCNSVGQTTGYFIAFILFLALESAEFCNAWLRSVPAATGLVTFSGFMYFWGWSFLVATIAVMLLKREYEPTVVADIIGDTCVDDGGGCGRDLSIRETYTTLWRIICLAPIQGYVVSFVMIKAGFSASDHVTVLKLIEKGVSREKMAFLGSLLVPVQIFLTLFISKHTTGPRPLSIFVWCIFPRLIFGPLFALLVYWTPSQRNPDSSYSLQYYVVLAILYSAHQFVVYPMFVSSMAFSARISDPTIGGTYMTLLNTVNNLASSVSGTTMLYLVDHLTIKRCFGGPNDGQSCSDKYHLQVCVESVPPGNCETVLDGYNVEILVCLAIGLAALVLRKRHLVALQLLPLAAWKVGTHCTSALCKHTLP